MEEASKSKIPQKQRMMDQKKKFEDGRIKYASESDVASKMGEMESEMSAKFADTPQ